MKDTNIPLLIASVGHYMATGHDVETALVLAGCNHEELSEKWEVCKEPEYSHENLGEIIRRPISMFQFFVDLGVEDSVEPWLIEAIESLSSINQKLDKFNKMSPDDFRKWHESKIESIEMTETDMGSERPPKRSINITRKTPTNNQ